MVTTTGYQSLIDALRKRARADLDAASDSGELEAWERKYLGVKGELTTFLRGLGGMSAEDRPAAGRAGNQLKSELAAAFTDRHRALQAAEIERRLTEDTVDVTLPGRPIELGHAHPVSQMIRELTDIFALMGFQTVFGPEIETGRYNFDMLNIPQDHPARDVWDTIIVDSEAAEIVLRTHTSPMQARVMEASSPPVRVVVPGRTYRYEAQDASHEWMFHQLEGLAVDEGITMADLKGVLQEMARQLFGPTRRIRFRCDFFPFVEPGVDYAVDCSACEGSGCRICKYTGWLELSGAGMVHPNVLTAVGYDPEKYTGFAFGLGIERAIMLRYGVTDIRAFAANDLRFLSQFSAVGRA